MGPTIFDHVKPNMTIAKEEIFAPVLSLLRASDLDEGLEYIRKSRFGNGATIYTKDAKAVRQFREEAEAGMLGINIGVPATMAFFPFSGWKDSFYGDLHVNGKDGVNFYTRKKMITSRFDIMRIKGVRGMSEVKENIDFLTKDKEYVWHSMKPYNPDATMIAEKAEGSWITDHNGKKFLDAMAGLWCVNVGYGRTELAEAAYRAVKRNGLFSAESKS